MVRLDVRDMLCAQALAAVAQAMERLDRGEACELLYNADDVKHDLLVWAQGLGHLVQDTGAGLLRLERCR